MIYELRCHTNYHSLRCSDLSRTGIDRLFNGTRIGDKWKPLTLEFVDKLERRKVGDFPSCGSIPVFSDRAAMALSHVLEGHGELLPIHAGPTPFFAFNVTRLANVLDEGASDVQYFSSGQVMNIARYVFDPAKVDVNLTIFKVPQLVMNPVLVTEAFVAAVQGSALKGFRFVKLWPHDDAAPAEASLQSLDDLLEQDARDELEKDFDTALWGLMCDRVSSLQDLYRWPEPVRVYYASRLLEWEVLNGGFAQAAMNIPEWFEEAAKGYSALGKTQCAELIRRAAETAAREFSRMQAAKGTIETAFAYFDEGVFDEFDAQLDALGWWAEEERIDYVRRNRDAFSDRTVR